MFRVLLLSKRMTRLFRYNWSPPPKRRKCNTTKIASENRAPKSNQPNNKKCKIKRFRISIGVKLKLNKTADACQCHMVESLFIFFFFAQTHTHDLTNKKIDFVLQKNVFQIFTFKNSFTRKKWIFFLKTKAVWWMCTGFKGNSRWSLELELLFVTRSKWIFFFRYVVNRTNERTKKKIIENSHAITQPKWFALYALKGSLFYFIHRV